MDKIVYEALSRYIHALQVFGYKKYKDVDSLLVLIFIREFLYEDFFDYVTSEDYKEISKLLYHLFGTNCLIPFPKYKEMATDKLGYGKISQLNNKMTLLQNSLEETAKDLQDEIAANKSSIETVKNRLNATQTQVQTIRNTKVVKAQ